MSDSPNQKEKFHHLITGQILLTQGEDAGLSNVFLNAVLTTKECVVGAHDIGRAQQILQMLFFKKVPAEDQQGIKIIDVVIMGIHTLGYMSDERFLQKPDNVEVQERAKTALKIVSSNDVVVLDPNQNVLN